MAEAPDLDWFESLVGFKETTFDETRSNLEVDGTRLRSRVNGRSFSVGALDLPSLDDLRKRAPFAENAERRLKTGIVRGDVRALLRDPVNSGAMFQVASQFNLLEMVSPEISPADGVARYAYDITQGPACAIAAGAATIYRNYFAQHPDRQLDALGDVGAALSQAINVPQRSLWVMRNGYAMPSLSGLELVAQYIGDLDESGRDALRGKLRIGIHSDVEVTDVPQESPPVVSQAFCSAMPISYTYLDEDLWAPFARLTLEAAYEATLRAALLNAQRGASSVVYLTLLGGGAFGNRPIWILEAMRRALALAAGTDLDVRLVSFNTPWNPVRELFEP